VAAELVGDGDQTTLEIEVQDLPLDLVWAYGAGWQVHVENLAAYLAGRDGYSADTRMDELEPSYRDMTVMPLDG
jgi:hypothetical protein